MRKPSKYPLILNDINTLQHIVKGNTTILYCPDGKIFISMLSVRYSVYVQHLIYKFEGGLLQYHVAIMGIRGLVP